MPECDGVEATIPLKHLAGLLIRLGYDSFESLGLAVGIDHAERRSGVVHHAQHCFVADVRFLLFGHLAVVAGSFRSLAVGCERVHSLREHLKRNAILLALHRCRGVTQQVPRHVDWLARSICQYDAVQYQSDQPRNCRLREVTPVPLKKVALRAKLFRLWVARIVWDHRHTATMNCLEQARNLLEVVARCRHVVFQPEIVARTAFGQQKLLHHQVHNRLARYRVTLRGAVNILDRIQPRGSYKIDAR
jgi:hypothetical protein